MPNIKKYFVIASIALSAQAVAVHAAEIKAAPAHDATPAEAAPAKRDSAKVATQAAVQAAKTDLATQPAHWSLLLVGAGVLLLPRKRRVDNSLR